MLKREREAHILRGVNLHDKLLSTNCCQQTMRQFRAELCFIPINALNLQDAVWRARVHIKKGTVESSLKSVCLAIGEKIYSHHQVGNGDNWKIDPLITELLL